MFVPADATAGPKCIGDLGLILEHGGDHFIGIQLRSDGAFRIVYNGKANRVLQYLKSPESKGRTGRDGAGKKLEPISLESWAKLDLDVPAEERIERRKQTIP